MERQLQRLNWLKVRDLVPAKIDTILLPVGTTEAHGSACLGTDNFIPESIALGIAEKTNSLVAPTVAHGLTKSLNRYPGSTGIKPETFGNYIRDILDSFVKSGFRNVFIINGHGGNNGVLKNVAHEFHQDNKASIGVIHWWELCAKLTEEHFGHVGGHAGTDETAMVQAIDPKLVDWDEYTPDHVYQFRGGADVFPVPGTILISKENVGLPENAQDYHRKVVAAVGEFVNSVLERWQQSGF